MNAAPTNPGDPTNAPAWAAACDASMRHAHERFAEGEFAAALRSLERAHVLGQRDLRRHVRVHVLMLRIGWALRDGREVRGQLLRLLLTPIGHLTGRLPMGNIGSASVGAFETMPIEPELARLLEDEA